MYINNKSFYSLQKSTSTIDDIINFALENKLPFIGVCDIQTTGHIQEFINKSKDKGVNPIVSVDTFIIFNNVVLSVIIVAKNTDGLKTLNKTITKSISGKYAQIDELTDVSIIINDEVAKKNKELLEKINNSKDLYLGIHDVDLVTNIEVTNKNILVEPSVFAKPADHEFYRMVTAISENQKIQKVKLDYNKNNYLKIYEISSEKFEKLAANVMQLVKDISYTKVKHEDKIPVFNKEIESKSYLETLAHKGLQKRCNNNISFEYNERLKTELEVIFELKYEDYFLVVWDIVKFCKQNNIYVGPGRGSAAASLVAYSLGITNIDPIEHELIFERFLNKQRSSLPDIDLDVEDNKREEVVNYIFNKYGSEYACKIGTLNTYQAKSAFRDIASAFSVSKTIVDFISKQIDSSMDFVENLKNPKIAKEFALRGELKYIYDYVIKIQKYPKSSSIHAAGVIISPESLFNYTAFKGNVSLASAEILEANGLVKFDLLALSNLRFIHDICDNVNMKYGKQIDINKIDTKDMKTYNMLSQGLTNEIFQFESKGIRRVLRKYQPKEFKDLAVVLSLYRPGPMSHIDDYILRMRKKQTYDFYFPELEPVLASTYGIIVYQEQIIKIVQIIADYDLAKADIFRRVISKKNKKELEKALDEFRSALVKKEYELKDIERLIEDILKFASYGYNKAHAVAYAKISYALAYLKTNFPIEFYMSALTSKKTKQQIEEVMQEMKYLNIEVLPPDIMKSEKFAVNENGKLRLGMTMINGISNAIIDELLEKRDSFKQSELKDILLKHIVPLELSDKEVENLVFSGFFNTFEYNEREIIEYIHRNNLSVDIDAFEFYSATIEIERKENYKENECELKEKSALTVNIRYKYFEKYYNESIKNYHRLMLVEKMKNNFYNDVNLFIRIKKVRKTKTKKGEDMLFIEAESIISKIDLIVFPTVYYKYEKQFAELEDKIVIVKVNKKNNDFLLNDIIKIY